MSEIIGTSLILSEDVPTCLEKASKSAAGSGFSAVGLGFVETGAGVLSNGSLPFSQGGMRGASSVLLESCLIRPAVIVVEPPAEFSP